MRKIKEEGKKVLLNLICKEQIDMIINDKSAYQSDYYHLLEHLKVEIKDL